ncbi:thioredoxin-like protein [Guyanagaster necrorhizus]|uniref:Thioredoxin-like protein n=1 Tax=Guyanagaster necrorhizus TaxID=856835 RepID=A0A9P8ASX3_9AGAR|nr:thioredoxin-like protein [Guyanagaster necrorhizus MCA 3950]KAG7446615.1 thioredoxin-like protein [Guyanagaster necrorhizus MCA 3950]
MNVSKHSTGASPIRRRRLIIFLAILTAFVLYFRSSLSLPESLKDVGDSVLSRASVAKLALTKQRKRPVDEIYGLIHLVTGDVEHEHILSHSMTMLDPTKPLDMRIYAADEGDDVDWEVERKMLDKRFPVVVFSKSYCQFSKRAKTLLESYDLDPPVKIIEVDLRDDSVQLKSLLTRLTSHSTFPNIVVRGNSIGGSDDLAKLHAEGKLKGILQGAGVKVKG